MEFRDKVVERLLAVGHLADRGVDVEPDELALVVVVHVESPVVPSSAGGVEDLRGGGGVLDVAPGAAGAVVILGGDGGEPLLILLGGPDAAARGEHVAEVLGQAFIDPEQIALHRLLVVAGGEARGTAVLAVPAMGELVRQQQAGRG